MALTYAELDLDINLSLSSFPYSTSSSFATTADSLVIVAIRTECDSITEAQHYTLSGDNITNSGFIAAKYRNGSTTVCFEWYSATGTGDTDNLTVNYNGSGLSFAGGITDTMHIGVWEARGESGLSVRQHKTAAASNATASVTLDSAVLAGNECFYTASWSDPTDVATPGSGWTELTEISVTNLHYAQWHSSPSGSQNGQVSNIASMNNVSIILEINKPSSSSSGGGFGHIPIN